MKQVEEQITYKNELLNVSYSCDLNNQNTKIKYFAHLSIKDTDGFDIQEIYDGNELSELINLTFNQRFNR
jgi:hypothetical protein